MSPITRRELLGVSALTLTQMLAKSVRADRHAMAASAFQITDIERHQILLPYHDFNARDLFRYHGLPIQLRTVYIVKTNQGMEGYGEAWGRGWPWEEIQRYLGTSPFDWIGDTKTLPMNMAMYDLMGKFLDVPVWKLIGARVRDRIPVCAWTVSRTPERMAEEVRHAARLGYRWLKYHVDEVQSVVAQTEAMQRVAPDGFKVHYDFNANSTFDAIAPIVKKLEAFPIVGRIEDPIVASDPEGWRRIREMTSVPIVVHHGPIDFMVDGIVDGLMAGHASIGSAARIAAVAETKQMPIMLQQAGGTINQAFLAHEAAVFKMATVDHCNLAQLWKDDITTQTMSIVDGHIRVPDGPGLGVSIDRQKLQRYASAPRPVQDRFLVRIRYQGGPTIYARHDPEQPGAADNMRYLKRLLGDPIPGPPPAYDNDVETDFWHEPSSDEFQRLWRETADGCVVR